MRAGSSAEPDLSPQPTSLLPRPRLRRLEAEMATLAVPLVGLKGAARSSMVGDLPAAMLGFVRGGREPGVGR